MLFPLPNLIKNSCSNSVVSKSHPDQDCSFELDSKIEFKIPESISYSKTIPPKQIGSDPSTDHSTPAPNPIDSIPLPLSSDNKAESKQSNLPLSPKTPSVSSSLKKSPISKVKKVSNNFTLPSPILKTSNSMQLSSLKNPSQLNIENSEETPLQKTASRPLFQMSPIPFINSPFIIDSNFQTPNIVSKRVPKLEENTEEVGIESKQNLEISRRIFESFVDDGVKEDDFGNKEEKNKNDGKFFINDQSKRETKDIDLLKGEIYKKKADLKEKKEINRDWSQKHSVLQEEVKKIELSSDNYRRQHADYERKIKRSSKTYSQILLPDFEEKEKELHMLGGDRNNLSKILQKFREENLEKTRRYDDQSKILSDKKKENLDLSEENEKIETLNNTLKTEINALNPENQTISFKYCWAQNQNKDITTKYKSFEHEIQKVKNEIKRIENDIKATQSQTLTNKSNISVLEQEINSILMSSDKKPSLYSPSSKMIQSIPQIHSLKPRHLSSNHEFVKAPNASSNLIELQKLSIYLLVVLIIIVIFK